MWDAVRSASEGHCVEILCLELREAVAHCLALPDCEGFCCAAAVGGAQPADPGAAAAAASKPATQEAEDGDDDGGSPQLDDGRRWSCQFFRPGRVRRWIPHREVRKTNAIPIPVTAVLTMETSQPCHGDAVVRSKHGSTVFGTLF
jgi:hypothetical protein